MSNPFMEAGPELLVLDSHDVVVETVVKSVRTIKTISKEQYTAYRLSVVEKGTKIIPGVNQEECIPTT